MAEYHAHIWHGYSFELEVSVHHSVRQYLKPWLEYLLIPLKIFEGFKLLITNIKLKYFMKSITRSCKHLLLAGDNILYFYLTFAAFVILHSHFLLKQKKKSSSHLFIFFITLFSACFWQIPLNFSWMPYFFWNVSVVPIFKVLLNG